APDATVAASPTPTPARRQSAAGKATGGRQHKRRLLEMDVTTRGRVAESSEEELTVRSELGIRARMAMSRHVSARVDTGLEYHLLWDGAADKGFHLHETRMREAALRISQGPWFMDVGATVLEWGGGGNLSPFTDLNPVDQRYPWMVLDDQAWPGYGSFTLATGAGTTHFGLEAAFIPFHRPHRLTLFQSDWSLLDNAPFQTILNLARVPPHGVDFVVFPSFLDLITDRGGVGGKYLPDAVLPDDDWTNSALCGRLRLGFEPVEVSLICHTGHDRTPTFRLSDELLETMADGQVDMDETDAFADGLAQSEVTFEERTLIGVDLKVATNYAVVRLELAHRDKETVYAGLYEVHRCAVIESCLSANAFLHPRLFTDARLLMSRVQDLPEDAWREEWESAGMVRLTLRLWDFLKPYAGGLVDLRSGTSLLDAGCLVEIKTNVRLALGARFQDGDESYLRPLRDADDHWYVDLGLRF
ncbi:hypothetical protein JW905_01330, partial [bacterium]|nr:hypothetical protein [candidate division CSSED10-310 bacterium]